MLSEEEKKKREEEARTIISSFSSGDITSGTDYANINIDTNENEETDFINKINEANDIINSINPIKNYDKNNEYAGNETNVNVENVKDNIITNNNETENLQKEKKKIDIINGGAFKDGYQFGDITKTVTGTVADVVGDLAGGTASVVENVLDVGANVLATGMDIIGLDDAAKGTREWANKNYSEKIGNAVANLTPVGALHNLINGKWNSFEDSSILGETSDKIVNLVGYTGGLALGGHVLGTVGGTTAAGSARLGVEANLGNIAVNIGNHVLNLPTLAIAGGMAGGLAEANAKGENVTELERWSKAISGGAIEGITEGLFGMLGIGGSDITDELIKTATSKITSNAGKMLTQIGIQCTGEAIEEFLSYAGNFVADNLIINNLGETDFSTEWDWADVGEQMALAFASTALSSGGTSVLQTNSAIKSAEKQLGRKLNNEEKVEVTQTLINNAMEEKEAIQFDPENKGKDVKTFYVANYDNEGNITEMVATKGKEIQNPNKKVNVRPTIVRNSITNAYNIMDANTGVLLDTTPYVGTVKAQKEFAHKMINLDDTTIKGLNEKITNYNIAIQNKMNEVIKQKQSEGNFTPSINTDTNINTSKINQESKSSTFYNTETNYAVQDVKKVTEPFDAKQEYTIDEMAEIWNNEIAENEYDVVYDNSGNVKSYIAIEEDGGNLVVNQYDSEDNIVKSEVIPDHKGKYTSKAIKDTIEKVSSLYDENRPIKGQQDIEGNEVRNMKKANQTDEQIRDIVKYNQDGREITDSNYIDFMVERYKDNINISNVETDTNYIKSISNKTKKEKINDLYSKIKDKEFKTTKKLYNESKHLETRQIDLLITKSGLNESFNKGFSDEKYAIVPFLDEIIKTSQDGIIRNETKQRENIDEWYYLYNTAKINNELYGIKIDIKKTGQGDRFYVHRVNLINKKGNSNLSRTPLEMEKSTNRFPNINNSIPQKRETVKGNTAINKQSMQKSENNTNSPDKNINSVESIEQKAIEKELHNRIQNAILSKNSRKNTILGNVSQKVVNKVQKLLGIDISGRVHLLADNDIRHMIKEHGNSAIEKAKGQVAITTRDIEMIPDIINNYDNLIQGSDNKQGKTIRYIKNYPNNRTYVVEVIPNANQKSLYIKTMWKKPSNTKIKEPVTLTNSQTTPSSTSKTRGNSGSNTSITQNMENVKDDGVRSMKKNNSNNINSDIQTDNQGRKLSKEQQEYFKDSKVKDEKGNIITTYHGSDFEFNIFKDKKAQHGRAITDGYYFTTVKENAESYGKNLKEVYLDIKNPFYLHDNNGVVPELRSRGYDIFDLIQNNKLDTDEGGYPTSKSLKKFIQKEGYDGIITLTGGNEIIDIENPNTQIVVFKSNQIKNIDNINPTSNEDIRFAKRTAKSQNKEVDKTQRNAEREGNYIEQEIRKIESTKQWDNSIPITKLTDIRKTIEDYLGLRIKKGHFRQAAYAIYKGNRDVIRTKEFKDMDSILHETGHALDIGNRLKIDKESIANELLTAIDKLGGYEEETRAIRLEEGFAEVIREYSIVPGQAKAEYPQTIAILEKIRQNDEGFNKFITKVQQQTYNYIHQNPRNRTLSNQSIGEQTDKVPLSKEWIKEKTIEHMFDKDYVVKSSVETLQKINGKTVNQLNASKNAYYMTRLSNATGDKAISMLTNGYIDEKGNQVMPGLNQIGEIFEQEATNMGLKGKEKSQAIEQRFNDLRAYLVAKRDTDYKSKGLKTGMRSMDTKAVIEQFANDTQIQQTAKIVYDTLDGMLQYAVGNGVITQESAKSLKESNAFYIPMQRVLENNGNQVGRKGAVADIIKKRTGSELDVKDVLENIIANSVNIVQQVENNNTLKALYNQGQEAGLTGAIFDVIDTPMTKIGTAKLSTWESELKNQGVDISKLDLDKTIDLFAPNNKVDTKNRITSFINDDGKRIYLQFNDDVLFSSIMGLDTESTSNFLNIVNKLNTPLRYGATMANIGFAIPNMISDTAQAAIFSTAGFIPVVDNALGVLDVLAATNKTVNNFMSKVAPEYTERINYMYTLYQQSGASSGTRIAQERKSVQSLMSGVYGNENLGIHDKFKPLKRLLDLMTYIPEISEQSTRFEVFKKNYNYYKGKGNAEMDARIMAALESRDATQDFSRMGKTSREINKLIPFSAARIGSSYTFAEKIKANPKQVATRIAVLSAITIAIRGLAGDDKEIEELNQRKKDDNFVFKVGDTIVTIKKPQGILRSMVNLTEYIYDLATGHIEEGKEGERLANWLNNAIMDNMPADDITGLVPSAITPFVENAINHDLYYDTDIVKSYDLDLPDAEQYYDYNSQVAIWLGQIFNYSPAKIDNWISGYFGGLGTQVTGAIDTILGKTGATVEKPDMGAESNAVGKRFIVNVNSNSASIDEIYNLKTELTKKKNGGTITDGETKQLETINSAISSMSSLNKQIKEIKKDLSLSGKEKAEQIKLLQQEKTDTARQALGKDVIHSESTSKIKVTQFYPKDTLSNKGYTLSLTTEMKKEYAEIASEYYNKYESQGIYSEDKLEIIKSKAKEYAKSKLFSKYKSDLVRSSK